MGRGPQFPAHALYDFNQIQADVLILGSFGKSIFARIYPPGHVARYWRKVARIEYYDIYVRRSLAPTAKNHRATRKGGAALRSPPQGGL